MLAGLLLQSGIFVTLFAMYWPIFNRALEKNIGKNFLHTMNLTLTVMTLL